MMIATCAGGAEGSVTTMRATTGELAHQVIPCGAWAPSGELSEGSGEPFAGRLFHVKQTADGLCWSGRFT